MKEKVAKKFKMCHLDPGILTGAVKGDKRTDTIYKKAEVRLAVGTLVEWHQLSKKPQSSVTAITIYSTEGTSL